MPTKTSTKKPLTYDLPGLVKKPILITGSRPQVGHEERYRPEMVAFAQELVQAARKDQVSIIVGDAEGIDTVVIDTCKALSVPCTVFGAYGRVRIKGDWFEAVALDTDYPGRNQHMVDLLPQTVFAVWDGYSGGTADCTKRAIKKGLSVAVFNFRDGPEPRVSSFIGGVKQP